MKLKEFSPRPGPHLVPGVSPSPFSKADFHPKRNPGQNFWQSHFHNAGPSLGSGLGQDYNAGHDLGLDLHFDIHPLSENSKWPPNRGSSEVKKSHRPQKILGINVNSLKQSWKRQKIIRTLRNEKPRTRDFEGLRTQNNQDPRNSNNVYLKLFLTMLIKNQSTMDSYPRANAMTQMSQTVSTPTMKTTNITQLTPTAQAGFANVFEADTNEEAGSTSEAEAETKSALFDLKSRPPGELKSIVV